MIYGYVRISTKRQSIERQIRNIKAAFPDAVIIKEVFTRTRLDRPDWLKLDLRRIGEYSRQPCGRRFGHSMDCDAGEAAAACGKGLRQGQGLGGSAVLPALCCNSDSWIRKRGVSGQL